MAVNQDIKRIVERIKFQFGKNQNAIAEDLGITKTYLSDVINGRAPMNDTLMEKIRNIYGLNSDEEDVVLKKQKTYGSSAVVSLPLIPIDAIAGFPDGADNEGVCIAQCEMYSVPEFNAKGADFLIRVSGSSMKPTFNNGDLLACRKIEDVTFFQWGTVYVLDTNQGAIVKRLFEDQADDSKIICRSDNFEFYPEFRIRKTEVHSWAIVVGMIRME